MEIDLKSMRDIEKDQYRLLIKKSIMQHMTFEVELDFFKEKKIKTIVEYILDNHQPIKKTDDELYEYIDSEGQLFALYCDGLIQHELDKIG